MSGISIGSGAVIATNSNVVKDVGPYEIVGGNPAKKIKDRFSDELKERLLKLKWWELELEVIQNIAPILSSTPSVECLDELLEKYYT
jgi:hypothetical protein